MIRVESLVYQYPESEYKALNNINFRLNRGDFLGIVGKNGSGKSTLCYAMMGIVPHFYHGTISGDVWVDGVNVPDASLAEMATKVGLVFQNPLHQFSGSKLTVAEELAFGLENLGVDRQTMIQRIEWAARILDISDLLKRNPFQLSGGQMQRVAIASILVLKPNVFVLDEPTSQLDPVGTNEVFRALRALSKEGITILVAEHKVELLAEYCNKIAVLNDGALEVIGTPDEVFANAQLEAFGVARPLTSEAYKRLNPHAQTVPCTLEETVERLNDFESHNRSQKR